MSVWHSFWHTYLSLLNEYGTDVKVQQELLRHADIGTTLNIYTTAVPERLRRANGKVVRLLLPTGTWGPAYCSPVVPLREGQRTQKEGDVAEACGKFTHTLS